MRRLKRLYKRRYPVDDSGTWAISYGDMITLLLTFFILFFSTDARQNHFRLIQNSLMDHLQNLKVTTNGLTNQLEIGNSKGSSIDDLVRNQLGAEISKNGKALVVEFNNVSFFKLGKIEVTGEGTSALHRFVDTYMRFASSFRLGIKAYTDHVPVRNGLRYKDNLELSALRAVATMRQLQKLGIPLRNMHIEGQGEFSSHERGVASTIEKGDPLARKVILVIEPDWKSEG